MKKGMPMPIIREKPINIEKVIRFVLLGFFDQSSFSKYFPMIELPIGKMIPYAYPIEV